MGIQISHLNKWFNHYHALNDINLTIEKGELVALLGPSGCGKTSLLRIIAGLELPTSGHIFFENQDISKEDIRNRHIGYVFQNFALFPHMKVIDNIAFGLRIKPKKVRLSPKEITKKAQFLLEMVQLEHVANHYPHELSGGQCQRIALARTLAINPKILLLDEPFSALDTKVRRELRRWLTRFHQEIQLTTLFVTHDQEEAMEIADRVVIMNRGIIEQIGSPIEILNNPANDFVYNFLGDSNNLRIGEKSFNFRPYEIDIQINDISPIGYYPAEVIDIRPLGALMKLVLKPQQCTSHIEAQIPKTIPKIHNLKKGQIIYFKPILDFEI
ncbi:MULTISPECIES: sulfate/molybdate ABC transporter ATP-binding protein [unclassified Commensalibacter]|uniref:sulfate/molybdate ABC transporter ATP-binding protein n=1 Tax=unclassified Commensalibacter TaxID=2630218 RepID=UPI0012D99B87|nr:MULTISPECIES: sulfate ABC transporter ATP-binding protein [unclassified Commensalibacter]MBH9970083.1 TOBE-like domain-containing protein [Commensalibacter sp. M0265]MBH9977731.1 TOBE-like domain-containing protein [Commensalibacter sp. M0266]MBH9993118.1 TOBE-like domain-containing protein [Commensalibacter sp. M0270]MBI0046907.1 TOBE-like domain-containing protein [Commensalibacter sp. M0267]MBI0056283.1 TOBE-like domain-containing protein [Commensalibacter sp. M0268]